jgi:outer membrane autotransporter protein
MLLALQLPFTNSGAQEVGIGQAAISAGPQASSVAARRNFAVFPFEPDDFFNPTQINNRFLPLVPGTVLVLEGQASRGVGGAPHRVMFIVTDLTKVINGVRTVVVWDRDVNNGQLVESELAFFAQDNVGRVWNLGEYPEEFDQGQFLGAPNTWIAGQAGAKAGVHMLAKPRVGRQRYLQGFAPDIEFLDTAKVLHTGRRVRVPFDLYSDVVVTDETSPLDESGAHQRKFHAPGVGIVKISPVRDPEAETLELVKLLYLSPEQLARVSKGALRLDNRGYEVSPDLYGQTPRAEHSLRGLARAGAAITTFSGTIEIQSASALGTEPLAFLNGTRLHVESLLNANGNWTVFPGTTTVKGGTVQTFGDFNLSGGGRLLVNAGFIVPGAANINNGLLVVNNQFTAGSGIDFNGNSGGIIKGVLTAPIVNLDNFSSLIVNNPGTVAADVNVAQNARLAVFGAINGSVMNAGFFQGTGVVAGNVVNRGIVAPGASVGRLTINGNYTQGPSGTLRIEVGGLEPSQHDLLAVNGQASLVGGLQLVQARGFRLSAGDEITFLTANNGVSGTFNSIENDTFVTGTIVESEVVYEPNAVVLKGTQGSFAEFAGAFCGTPNSVAVGQALDSAVGDPRASELIGFLNNQTLTNLCDDLDLISPEQLTSIFVIGVSLANVQTANLERRMDDIHRGSTGFSSSGFAINGSGPSFSEGFAGVSGPEGKSGPAVFAPVPQNRWGVFVTGIGEFTDVDSTFNASGYDLATGGFTMGIDYRIGSHFAIGLTAGYAYTHADLVNDSSIAVNGGKLGLYATAFGSGFYLDTAVIGSLNGYDTRRTALEGTASGETLGGDLNALVAAGYDWKKGGLSIGPTASFQYTLVGFGDFTESGSLAPLAFPDQQAESFRTAFGMKASYDWKIGLIRFIPEVRLAWQHEFGETDYSLVSSFASGAGNSFTVNGPEIGRDSMLLGAGFAIHWNDRISTYAYYDGELFRTNYLSNNVSMGVRITF